MKFLPGLAWLVPLHGVAVHAICSSNLLVDNFSRWSTRTNSLGQQAAADETMTYIAASSQVLTFIPATANSYFYETFVCQQAATNRFDAISFAVQGPVGASFILELQTRSSCSDTNYTSTYYDVGGLTGSWQAITVPLSSFAGANPDAIAGLVWQGFSSVGTAWRLYNIQLVCNPRALPPTTTTPAVTTTPVTTIPPETSASITTSVTSLTTTSTLNLTITPRTPTEATAVSPSASAGCQALLLDDWESQSRLTFLYYNALLQSSSDDGTMKSIVVSHHRVTLTPTDDTSYLYSQVGCQDVSMYGGISLRIKAAPGTSLTIQLSSPDKCGGNDSQTSSLTAEQLGWEFDGTEKLFSIPLAKFTGFDHRKMTTLMFTGLNRAITLGPMQFYCPSKLAEYVVPPTILPSTPVSTVPAPANTAAAAFVVDQFANKDTNALGLWHGIDDDPGLTTVFRNGKMTLSSNDSDLSWYTQLSNTCVDITKWSGSYLHIAYTGSNKFSVALQQHNAKCDNDAQPTPETWDSLEAARYASDTDIYMPLSHFHVNQSRAIGFALKGFYTSDPTVFSKIEVVESVPAGFHIPNKLPSGNLVFSCKRPNSFAFAIDDGDPKLAQQVMETVKEENITVTFFTVGAALDDPTTNLSNVYNDMMARGHQIALHSFTHPKMEGLSSYADIDWEYNNDVTAVKKTFNGFHTPYFRPPFGTEGARMRQRLSVALETDNPYIVMWSIDVEDWLWAESTTPEKQLAAFKRDLAKGGNLVVMHYLYPTTVGYLKQFIQLAKATGKQLMRVDQCMEDPNAPPL